MAHTASALHRPEVVALVDIGLVGAVGGVLLALGGLVLIMVLTSPGRRRRHARQLDDMTAQQFAQRAERLRQ